MIRAIRKFIGLIIVLAIFFGLGAFVYTRDFSGQADTSFGVTFSNKYAEELELDWQATYLAILDELKVKKLRLIAYWDEIEAEQDAFDFSRLDWQVSEAANRGAEISLVVGRRAPRWPECHDPDWLARLAPLAVQRQQLEFIKEAITRYKDNLAIKTWQVENEPLFNGFGECPNADKDFLKQEVDLVRSLDPGRPIIITDSGELSHWQAAASLGDILGVTLYRIVWNETIGFWDYFFIPPAGYRYKADLTKSLHKELDKVIVTEMQMEPWSFDRKMVNVSYEDQQKSFNLKRFRDNIDYVQRAGFDEVYLWGVEYWYWLNKQGYTEIWEEAKSIWKN
ncbi:hypothetical protein HYZ76_01050 [Candidatus Falkowbacteria bacterium]|nr:hypothetical protein [Candidatus Falkowbacteria bacterium]